MKRINIPSSNLGHYIIPEDCLKNICVDVGANVGDFTISQANIFKTVHFYEPFKPCFDKIQDRIKNLSNVKGFNEAVYKESNLYLPMIAHINYDAGSNALKTDVVNEHWIDELDLVTTVSFSDVLQRVKEKINYLKIDCETSEYYFLINQDLSSVDYIGIELHWQMGEKKYNELVKHIFQTHSSTDDVSFTYDMNKEILFKNNLL